MCVSRPRFCTNGPQQWRCGPLGGVQPQPRDHEATELVGGHDFWYDGKEIASLVHQENKTWQG